MGQQENPKARWQGSSGGRDGMEVKGKKREGED
jgi:hypothetical protein